MSKGFRFKLNKSGVRDLLKSSEMQGVLQDAAQGKAQEAGNGYEAAVHLYKNRAVAHIYPGDFESQQDNYKNNTLEKVIG